jgi:tripartite-type tricarboxylate transporter receptor subunit TctC
MRAIVAVLTLAVCGSVSQAEEVSFRGKTIRMIVGFAAGGGTDAAARRISTYLGRHLPGSPTVILQYIPGADGLTAMNYLVQQARPDGLTITMGSGSQADPMHYRKPQSNFDPTKFAAVGGVGLGGTALIIRQNAIPRLYDKTAAPIVMGALSGMPRSGMLMAAWGKEFLGWNVKWVLGYRGTSDLIVALERGEIDMTATGSIPNTQRLTRSGDFTILAQSGTLYRGKLGPRPEFGDASLLPAMINGKISDPVQSMSFDYWSTLNAMDKWLALPPTTPTSIVHSYRAAFKSMTEDPEFIAQVKDSTELTPTTSQDVSEWLEKLGLTTNDAMKFITVMLGHQGIHVD